MLPKGFRACGLHCGIAKKEGKKDIALFYSEVPAVAAAMFTENCVKAAPVIVSRKHVQKNPSTMRAVVANSGCANACTGTRGLRDAERECAEAARLLGLRPEQVMVASTGVIGRFLPSAKISSGIETLVEQIAKNGAREVSAAQAIMTTDTVHKIAQRTVRIGGRSVSVWGCAKGAGMIHPDIALPHATMLSFILTDAAVAAPLLREALEDAADASFNCVSVDGDTSTNDTLILLANGAAGNTAIAHKGKDFELFRRAVAGVCLDLAKMLARDGEGATRLVVVEVRNAATPGAAKKIAATIATSPLVKTAVFGNDANWGRIIGAAGRAGVCIVPEKTDIFLGPLKVASRGMAAPFSEARAKKILQGKEVRVIVDLHAGRAKAVYYTCDFSFDYVKINASYRS